MFSLFALFLDSDSETDRNDDKHDDSGSEEFEGDFCFIHSYEWTIYNVHKTLERHVCVLGWNFAQPITWCNKTWCTEIVRIQFGSRNQAHADLINHLLSVSESITINIDDQTSYKLGNQSTNIQYNCFSKGRPPPRAYGRDTWAIYCFQNNKFSWKLIGSLKIVSLESRSGFYFFSRTLFFRIRTRYCTINFLKTIDSSSVPRVRPSGV